MNAAKNRRIAYDAANTIRLYWAGEVDHAEYELPQVSVNPDTYEITSNMVNGMPPLRKKSRAR